MPRKERIEDRPRLTPKMAPTPISNPVKKLGNFFPLLVKKNG